MGEVNYGPVIQDMTWSYSRISAFHDCPYRWYLKYICGVEGIPLFFSDYGKFMHKLIELYLKGDLKKDELESWYLTNFRKEVRGTAPSFEVFKNYFEQGLQFCRRDDLFPHEKLLLVETKVDFFIGDKPFTGILDYAAEDSSDISVGDNKSRALKPRSSRKKPTKSDEELDRYLRQLYLYSVPIKSQFGKHPEWLELNCFRTGELIAEPFNEEKLEEAKQWALKSIDEITNNDNWAPNMDYWKCRYLCDMNEECEYFQINSR